MEDQFYKIMVEYVGFAEVHGLDQDDFAEFQQYIDLNYPNHSKIANRIWMTSDLSDLAASHTADPDRPVLALYSDVRSQKDGFSLTTSPLTIRSDVGIKHSSIDIRLITSIVNFVSPDYEPETPVFSVLSTWAAGVVLKGMVSSCAEFQRQKNITSEGLVLKNILKQDDFKFKFSVSENDLVILSELLARIKLPLGASKRGKGLGVVKAVAIYDFPSNKLHITQT